MNGLLLLLGLALAAETPELPTLAVTAIGLDAPTASGHAPGWRAAIPTGGLVKVFLAQTEAEAELQFQWQERTAQAGVWPEADPAALGVDQAKGDGTVSLLVRKGTVVVYVRDLEEHSGDWVKKILPIVASP